MRWWKSYEAVLAKPMVVLPTQKENVDGLGRVVVLVPSCDLLGRLESGFFLRTVWMVVSLVAYTSFYGTLFVYGTVEWACFGWPGVAFVTLVVTYSCVDNKRVVVYGNFAISKTAVALDCCVLMICIVTHVWRWYEAAPCGRCPMTIAQDCFGDWLRDMEELEKAERMREAFWRAAGSTSDIPRVRTLSDIPAERRALQAKMKQDEQAASRRGRRVLVGEDVPSENSGNRLEYSRHCSPSGVANELLVEDQVEGDERASGRSAQF
ncbi:hypothetical protein PC119_g21535 [Phytophthora cactorum]|uniref:Transmembrane protein n=1 Tax=Phytophthora cactorum TaxID=29920 RepID=A0A8T1BJ88_9STRA|nr:hypothetical protein PC111_g18110 [Phytophthora cactorum]KAG2880609.1 hypothetical protein PC114_g21992 [Phytophthora cactorum]KAG2901325.1 hypothetical protein PC117_g21770 [Phytophthora cactorum]KAG2979245.1 hypothetical protein PC119_g21535 [Phytophthora cactorum]KAG3060210.1 hypothetical protein PC122_g20050 [Phytophthora cactorum]